MILFEYLLFLNESRILYLHFISEKKILFFRKIRIRFRKILHFKVFPSYITRCIYSFPFILFKNFGDTHRCCQSIFHFKKIFRQKLTFFYVKFFHKNKIKVIVCLLVAACDVMHCNRYFYWQQIAEEFNIKLRRFKKNFMQL